MRSFLNCFSPSGYQGLVIKETKEGITDQSDREFTVTHQFEQFTAWGWDQKPANFNIDKVIQIQHALHKPIAPPTE